MSRICLGFSPLFQFYCNTWRPFMVCSHSSFFCTCYVKDWTTFSFFLLFLSLVSFFIMYPGRKFGCSCWRMDCWWDCIDFTNGRGEKTWYCNPLLHLTVLLCEKCYFLVVYYCEAYLQNVWFSVISLSIFCILEVSVTYGLFPGIHSSFNDITRTIWELCWRNLSSQLSS